MYNQADVILCDPLQQAPELPLELAAQGFLLHNSSELKRIAKSMKSYKPKAVLVGCPDHAASIEQDLRTCCNAIISAPVIIFGSLDEHQMLQLKDWGADLVEDVANIPELLRELIPASQRCGSQTALREPSDLQMKVDDSDLANIIQFIAGRNRCGELSVQFEMHEAPGRIFFRDQLVLHAEFEDKFEIDAIAAMLAAGPAMAHFIQDLKPVKETMHSRADDLLLTATVYWDEHLRES